MYKYNVSDDLKNNAINFFESEVDVKPKRNVKDMEMKALFEAQKVELEKEFEKANNTLNIKRAEDIARLIEMVQGKIAELEAQEEVPEDNEEEEFLGRVQEKYGRSDK